MANNELVLLDEILRERQDEREQPLPEDKAFEIFACEQVVRQFDLSPDEISDGVVGGGNDGGLDGIYVFLGDVLLAEDSEVFEEGFSKANVPHGTCLRLYLVQAKRDLSFREAVFDSVSSSARKLLDLSQSDGQLLKLFSPVVVAKFRLFKSALTKLAVRHLEPEIQFSYASRGETQGIHPKVAIKSGELEEQFSGLTSDAKAKVEFLGAAELRGRASIAPSYTVQLSFQEQATGGGGYVAIVKLRDYLEFLRDESNELRRHIFDWNVRDYEGDVEVNKEIRQTLEDGASPEFWWLNNGVTVICSRASTIGKTFTLDDVQVVNGLQTSETIFRVLGNAPGDHTSLERAILVRIVVTEDLKTRDRIIRATNRQTSVPAASLRATDAVQRKIEAYFHAKGWFYDRRKNYYKNLGKGPDRIVSIPLLAQAMMAMGLGRPDDSRARPSSLLKRDEDYGFIFSEDIDLPVYLWAAKSQKTVDKFLLLEGDITPSERTNLRFHLAMLAATRLAGKRIEAPSDLRALAESDVSILEADLGSCLADVRAAYAASGSVEDSMDKIAKGPELVHILLDRFEVQ